MAAAAASPAAAACTLDAAAAARNLSCRDATAASNLKLASILIIFLTSLIGISTPILLARLLRGRPIYDKAVLIIKCFAAGVILSTSLVHVLPDAYASLADCAVSSRHPWKDFPFVGLFTLIGSLLALLVEITAAAGEGGVETEYEAVDGGDWGKELGEREEELELVVRMKKRRLVSQVLEIGIIFHSVVIGVTMGTSQNRCTIKPLMAALSFHQLFEGMGLGGCIAQASFSLGTTAYMCAMFAVTTPMGILLGMTIFWLTGYDDTNPNALIMEGLLSALSSGILVYMGLVDLIALDFFHNKLMRSTSRLTRTCFLALVLGSASMSILALWA